MSQFLEFLSEIIHACRLLNHCASQKAGIEGAVHALQSLWDKLLFPGPNSDVDFGVIHGAIAGHTTVDGTMGGPGALKGTTPGLNANVDTGIIHKITAGHMIIEGSMGGTGA